MLSRARFSIYHEFLNKPVRSRHLLKAFGACFPVKLTADHELLNYHVYSISEHCVIILNDGSEEDYVALIFASYLQTAEFLRVPATPFSIYQWKSNTNVRHLCRADAPRAFQKKQTNKQKKKQQQQQQKQKHYLKVQKDQNCDRMYSKTGIKIPQSFINVYDYSKTTCFG